MKRWEQLSHENTKSPCGEQNNGAVESVDCFKKGGRDGECSCESTEMKEERRSGEGMRVDQSDDSQVSAGLPESGALKDF